MAAPRAARRAGPGGGRRLAAIGLASIAAVVAALVSQHVFDMQPCPWCVLQRLIFVLIGMVALAGSLWQAAARRVTASLTGALALCGAAAALWQHFKAAASASCNLTLADKIISGLQLDSVLPAVFEPRASCADAAVKLLGLPYDFWSLALFLVIAGAALQVAMRRRSVR